MQGTPKAIEIKGIVRNATVIGAQDGQAEDLINLRFMDGSWRASGDGRLVHTMSGTQYSQLYVHTNVYHHLLGVNNGTLYWFAEIGTDGVSFYPLDNTTSRTNWPQDMQSIPTVPVAVTTVVGDVWITQTGHLLSIIDESDDFAYVVYKTSNKEYIEVHVDANGNPTNRILYPFGQVHLNLYSPGDDEHKTEPDIEGAPFPVIYQATDILVKTAQKKNQFSQHFLAIVAFELYDGSYAYASNPVHLCPKEGIFDGFRRKKIFVRLGPQGGTYLPSSLIVDYSNPTPGIPPNEHITPEPDPSDYQYVEVTLRKDDGVLTGVDSDNALLVPKDVRSWLDYSENKSYVCGSDLVLSIDKSIIDNFDENIFNSICVFVTTESNVYPTVSSRQDLENRKDEFDLLKAEKYTYFRLFTNEYKDGVYVQTTGGGSAELVSPFSLQTFEYQRKKKDIMYDLLHSPFYLIKKYKKEELYELLENPVVNLNDREHEGILLTENLVQQKTLPIEATSRTTYLPKVSYMYNGRLHIANYKSFPFFGYPIDLFHLHNHSVKVQANSWYKGVLENLADNNDDCQQHEKAVYNFTSDPPSELQYFAYIQVSIDSSQGEKKVVRYIPLYDFTTPENGRADFIESLNPLLTYPDARAKEMTIRIFKEETTYQGGALYLTYSKTVQLKPHPYLNLSYYFDPDLKPIALAISPSISSSILNVPNMVNTEEYFPNGLKVSKTDNPMFFPVENAYQVGSAEILALMSNTIAVGTGQTGAAPLYVFCKDGVYALFVDASGQMTYSNSRVLARDVCNNPSSVTPIDAGVVFTTDRGLMMIAGEQVEEIGQPAEGDVLQYVDSTKVDYSKYAFDALTKIAGLPSSLCDTTDFLTYLQGAIINYNHNLRELIATNPNKSYSYVLDREGNWSRRDYTAAEYVNNYPTSYRVTSGGQFYKLDDDGDANTSQEHRKEADNQIFYISNVIKLDSIGFKQAYRFVVRGYFETINPYYWQEAGRLEITGSKPSQDMLILDATTYAALEVGDAVRIKTNGIQEVSVTGKYANNLVQFSEALDAYSYSGQFVFIKRFAVDPAPNIGIVVEGSYDGIKFSPLGFNRKAGKFTNIGCHVSHTDVRFYRVILCGQVTGKTRIDYMELSADGSVLNTKIR